MADSILCIHLLDDFSGSAKVFSTAIEVLRQAGHHTEVIVGSQGKTGFIRRKHAVSTVPYRFFNHRALLLLSFVFTQCWLFFKVCHLLLSGRARVVYVNTVLPAGAILAGALCQRPVFTHVHEVGMGSRLMFRCLLGIATRFSSRIITVSNYVATALQLQPQQTTVIHNTLDPEEWQHASAIARHKQATCSDESLRVLMACSLKWYKGVDAFIALAHTCRSSDIPSVRQTAFTLVLNCSPQELLAFKSTLRLEDGIEVVHRPASVYDHYRRAGLVLNLSLPEGWVETFGLTLLEAMSCGVPVISPTVGGCLELFETGCGGWHIDARDTRALVARIHELSAAPEVWHQASQQAYKAACRFSPNTFSKQLISVFSPL